MAPSAPPPLPCTSPGRLAQVPTFIFESYPTRGAYAYNLSNVHPPMMGPRFSYLREHYLADQTGALIVRGDKVMFESLERSKPHVAALGLARECSLLMTTMNAILALFVRLAASLFNGVFH